MGSCLQKPTHQAPVQVFPEKNSEGGKESVKSKTTGKVSPTTEPVETQNQEIIAGSRIAKHEDSEPEEVESSASKERKFLYNLNQKRLRDSRTVRVFISSTFRDFAMERDYLMRHTLPQLRKIGEDRGVTVIFVDLRWGVTSDESSGGAVVKLCLQEIDACRPFFVGMLGDRYGWHLNEDYDDALLKQTMDIGQDIYPWVKGYRKRSVTELEMLHGALLEPSLSNFSSFYFREKDKFIIEMEKEINSMKYDISSFEAENSFAKDAQDKLKENIRNTFPNNVFSYSNLKQFSDKLVEDLTAAIDNEFSTSANVQLSVWDKFEMKHEAFAASKRLGYTASKNLYSLLDDYCKSNIAERSEQAIATCGPSGSGKSALLANWSKDYINRHKDTITAFVHFVGATPESTSHIHILRRILGTLSQKLSLDMKDFLKTNSVEKINEKTNEDIIRDFSEQELSEVFPDFMVTAALKAKELQPPKSILLVIDGLDELEDRSNAHSLYWLQKIPGVPLITSIKKSRKGEGKDNVDTTAYKYWTMNKWDTVEIHPFTQEEKKKATVNYLAEHAKKFDETQISLVAEKEETSNPLYLRTLLDEARLFGDYFTFTDHLKGLLEAKSNSMLFNKVLKRMAKECGKELTKVAVSCILCCRDGLTDDELKSILRLTVSATEQGFANIKNDSYTLEGDRDMSLLVQLLFGIREQLCGPGLLHFSHDSVKKAVVKFIGGEEAIVHAHRRLAQYFSYRHVEGDSEDATGISYQNGRMLREFPTHLLKSEQYDKLAEYISSFKVLDSMLSDEAGKYELISYWTKLDDHWQDSKNTAAKFLSNIASDVNSKVLNLLQNSKSVSINDQKDQIIIEQSEYLDRISYLLVLLGFYEESVKIRQNELSINTALYGEYHSKVSASCSELAKLYETVYSNYSVSMKLRKQALDIDKQVLGEDHKDLAVTLENLASLYLKLGDFDNAKESYLDALKKKESHYGKDHREVAATVSQIGNMLEEKGQYDEAIIWCKRALAIREKSFGSAHPSVARSLIDLAMLSLKKGGGEIALPQLLHGLDILKSSLGEVHTDVAAATNNVGLAYSELNQFEKALNYYERAKLIQSKRLGDDHPSYAATCTNIGSVCQELTEKSFSEANKENNEDEERYFQMSEEHYSLAVLIYSVKLGNDHPDRATVLHNLGTLYFDAAHRNMARYNERNANEESEEADVSTGLFETAKSYFEQALQIRNEKLGEKHPSTLNTMSALETCCNDIDNVDILSDFVEKEEVRKKIMSDIYASLGLNQGEGLSPASENFKNVIYQAAEYIQIDPPKEKDISVAISLLGYPTGDSSKYTQTQVEDIFSSILSTNYI